MKKTRGRLQTNKKKKGKRELAKIGKPGSPIAGVGSRVRRTKKETEYFYWERT